VSNVRVGAKVRKDQVRGNGIWKEVGLEVGGAEEDKPAVHGDGVN